MPNRILKESICESRTLSECSFFTQDFYKRLITYADDYGRFNADTKIMLARLYPREVGIVCENDIIDACTELAGVGKIAFYTSQPRKEVYGCFPKWEEHQRVRNSKKKNPDPTDTWINDWYLRRFVPMELKKKIVERDKFKCCICGKFLTTEQNTERFLKLGLGTYHFDHIVPCCQGGRCTIENLRLTCSTCNLSRKGLFTFDEILDLTLNENTQENKVFLTSAESCGEFPPNPIRIQSESNPNPIRIQSESNPNSSKTPAVPFKKIQDLFNNTCQSLSKIEGINGKRKESVGARWKENPDINFFSDLFVKVENSDFLKGENDRKWKADFDWLMRAGNLDKVREGKYDNREVEKDEFKLTGFKTDIEF